MTPRHHNDWTSDMWGMSSDCDRQTVAEIRVQLALDSIQEAQQLVQQPAQGLSRVDGMIPECRSVGSVSDRLWQTWFAVCASANRLRCKRHLKSRDRQ
jgi:hypothetical protein